MPFLLAWRQIFGICLVRDINSKEVVSRLNDPAMARAYAMTAENGHSASPEDRTRAIVWVIQYPNHFQIVYDLYHIGTLDEARYKLWSIFNAASWQT